MARAVHTHTRARSLSSYLRLCHQFGHTICSTVANKRYTCTYGLANQAKNYSNFCMINCFNVINLLFNLLPFLLILLRHSVIGFDLFKRIVQFSVAVVLFSFDRQQSFAQLNDLKNDFFVEIIAHYPCRIFSVCKNVFAHESLRNNSRFCFLLTTNCICICKWGGCKEEIINQTIRVTSDRVTNIKERMFNSNSEMLHLFSPLHSAIKLLNSTCSTKLEIIFFRLLSVARKSNSKSNRIRV